MWVLRWQLKPQGYDWSPWSSPACLGAEESPTRATHPPESPSFSSQVYERLEKLQAAVAGPSLELEAASRSPPSPQENSYMSTTSSASPWQPLAAPAGSLAQAPERLQQGPNQPVESDESVSDLSAALHSWHLTASCPAGPALPDSPGQGAAAPLGQASGTQRGPAQELTWGSGPEPRSSAVEGSWDQVPGTGTRDLLWQQCPYLSPPAFWDERTGPAVRLTLSLASSRPLP